MNEPIKAGDLVVVVRWPHEHGGKYLGRVYQVVSLWPFGVHCPACGKTMTNGTSAEITINGTSYGLPLPWLKRIPPFPELKDERHDEEITA